MQTIFYRNLKHPTVQLLNSFRIGAWVHLEFPTTEEITKLAERFDLNKLILEDIFDEFEIPRIEKETDKMYFFIRFISQKKMTKTIPLLFVIGPDFIITITTEKIPFLEAFVSQADFFTTQKTKLLIQLLLAFDDDYERHIKHITKKIHRISARIETIGNKNIAQFVQYEAIFNEFLLGLKPTGLILEKLLAGKYVRLYEEDKELIEDLYLSGNQLVKMCEANLKHLVNVREAYTTIISNNLNKTIKFLTSVTLILTIPTMVFSFYGMNVALPFEAHPFAFFFILLGTTVGSSVLLVYFNKRDLL